MGEQAVAAPSSGLNFVSSPNDIFLPSVGATLIAYSASVAFVVIDSMKRVFFRRSVSHFYTKSSTILPPLTNRNPPSSVFGIALGGFIEASVHHSNMTKVSNSTLTMRLVELLSVGGIQKTSAMGCESTSEKVSVDNTLNAAVTFTPPSCIPIAGANELQSRKYSESLSRNINSWGGCLDVGGRTCIVDLVLAHDKDGLSSSEGRSAPTDGLCVFHFSQLKKGVKPC